MLEDYRLNEVEDTSMKNILCVNSILAGYHHFFLKGTLGIHFLLIELDPGNYHFEFELMRTCIGPVQWLLVSIQLIFIACVCAQ